MPDREKILEALRRCLPETEIDGMLGCDTCPYEGCESSVGMPINLMENIRTLLKSQPEIVRCKDCRWQNDDEHCPVCNECGRKAMPSGEWFCADGKRRYAQQDEKTGLA